MELSKEEVFERLQKVLKQLLKAFQDGRQPKIEWSTDIIDDLGIDSVETLDLMNAIEEEFQINPNLSEGNTKRKVGDIVEYILELSKG